MHQLPEFWAIPAGDILGQLQTSPQGLTSKQADKRLKEFGPNTFKAKKAQNDLYLLFSQFKSPIILILIVAAGLSLFLGDHVDSIIIMTIVLISGVLGFWQERGAANAVAKLLSIVQITAEVLRDNVRKQISIEGLVPGDIVILNAGDIIPGDCMLLESKTLYVDEAALTGETYPQEKLPGVTTAETPLAKRTNTLFMGTHVVSGSATAVIVHTGTDTEFGSISGRLAVRLVETEFEHGIRRFGYMLMEITLLLVFVIFAVNVYLARPVLDSFLFAMALAVGLTPQLLPAIITINLSHGAKSMASKKVIVKRLAAIENFGSMNILCSDKTGTLTEGIVRIDKAIDVEGNESEKVLLYAYLNSYFETGFTNPIDEAVRGFKQPDISGYSKIDEEPYDFVRRRLSISVAKGEQRFMITKGALKNVLEACSTAAVSGSIVSISEVQGRIDHLYEELGSQGYRTIGIAYKEIGPDLHITKEHETGMTFLGFLVLCDPEKTGVADTIDDLRKLGVSLKIITGDSRLVAAHVSREVGLGDSKILAGPELYKMSDEALHRKVNSVDVFAEIEPNQKERIILALRKSGNVVGYMGDGINDASALHSADVGISVDSAVDVAKDAADIVLLEKDLGVLVQGVREGRTTFANTLKYVFMATSANFGNMFSMAGASLFLPFLPLLPKQILLTNLLTDLPEMTISKDNVDGEFLEKPRRWDISFIRKFMMTFGLLSSVFDYLTFGVLIYLLNAAPAEFRAGWFVESVVSASIVVLVVRTRRPFFRSMPGRLLLIATLLVAVVTLFFPYTPVGQGLFGFTPLPLSFLLMMGFIVVLYIFSAEAAKRYFYRRVQF